MSKYFKEYYIKNKSKLNKSSIERRNKNKHKILFILSYMYSSQKTNSKARNHPMPNYTKKEFMDWAIKETDFIKIYINWCKGGFKKDDKPSVDRIDNSKGYSFENIRMMTWRKNNELGRISRRRPIEKICKHTGSPIELYPSLTIACKENELSKPSLLRLIKVIGKNRTNFIWKYHKC